MIQMNKPQDPLAPIYIREPMNVPLEDHYMIFVSSSVYHEGDERSRTNPGHGYPAYTENTVSCIAFKTVAGVENWILQEGHKKSYRITFNRAVSVKKKVLISVM